MPSSSRPAESSEGGCASVLSEFGELGSSASVALESTKTAKPGKKLIRSWDGFWVSNYY